MSNTHYVFEPKFEVNSVVYFKQDISIVHKVKIRGFQENVFATTKEPPVISRTTLYNIEKPDKGLFLVESWYLFTTAEEAFK